MPLFLPAVIAIICVCSCAFKTQIPLPYPDLAIISVKQSPTIAAIGRKIHLTVEIANIGNALAPATTLRLSDQTGKIISEKPISALHPQVNLTFKIDLPQKVKTGNFILSIDPEKRIYEREKLNNVITVGIRVVNEAELKNIDSANEEEFLAEMKKNNADACKDKIIISSFSRLGKTMNFETAYSGESVKFKIELENRCDRELYDLFLTWTQREEDDSEAAEKIFGQVKIDKLIQGEKRILYRTLTAAAGKWRIGLKLDSMHASDGTEEYLEPIFILLVQPEE
jgi:hypothetical protein